MALAFVPSIQAQIQQDATTATSRLSGSSQLTNSSIDADVRLNPADMLSVHQIIG
jgi:hypothetical protein